MHGRYFWHVFILIIALTLITFLFFAFSVKVKNSINYTDKTVVTAPLVTTADPSIGPATAPVTLVDYGDYECPSCATIESTLNALKSSYGDSLRLVWKDLPNDSIHHEATNAAVAARCAGKQGKFWEYHALLMANQSQLGSGLYTELATQLKLNTGSFASCVTNKDTLPLVQRTYDEGIALGIPSTPSIWLNGVRFNGNPDAATLKRAIDLLVPKK